MGKNKNTRILMQFTALAMVLIAAMMVEEAKSISLCNVDTNDMEKCRPAVTGKHPRRPRPDCCAVLKAADLGCLCPYKSYLPSLGINPSKVKYAIAKCGAKTPYCFRRG